MSPKFLGVFLLLLALCSALLHRSEAASARPARCVQPIESGTCFAAFKKFAYVPETDNCVEFTFGGCRGNENNFDTLQNCLETCVVADE